MAKPVILTVDRATATRGPLATIRLVVLVAAALALACAPADRSGRSPDGSTLTVLYVGDERILSPSWDMPAQFLMFLPLARYDEDGNLEGVLARSWEHSRDYRTWTIRLRGDVRWHDGVRFTAHDVKFTVDSLEVMHGRPYDYAVAVLDDTTFTVADKTGCGLNPLDDYQVFYPRHVLEDEDLSTWTAWDFWIRPVGNGPFRYVRHVPKTMMEFEANPDYYAGRPRIDRLILKFGEASVVELTSGNVDVAGWVVPAEARRLARDPRFRAYWEGGGMPRAILWNTRHPLFRDARVRRAMTHAINRRELHAVLAFPDRLPIFDGPVSQRQRRRGDLPEPLAYDPDLAARLLNEAGWRDLDGDGVRERGSMPFQFELLVPTEVADAGVYVQDQLRRVGVQVDVQVREFPMLRRLWRNRGDFAAMIEFVQERWFETFFGSESVLGYDNPRIAASLRALVCTVDPDARDALYRRMIPIFQAEQPATFLFPMVYWFVTSQRVRGLSSPWRADPLMNLDRIWLEEQRP